MDKSINDAIRAISLLKGEVAKSFMVTAAEMIAKCYEAGGKLLICGNGGSLCDAMHFAEEMTGQFRGKRKALAALALSDAGHMTCVGNDMGFDHIFSRHIEGLGKKEDILIVLTTSGKSPNILNALHQARAQGMKTIAFLGKDGGKAKGNADLEWIVEGFEFSDRIQEAHMTAIHIIIEMVEKALFGMRPAASPSAEQNIEEVCL